MTPQSHFDPLHNLNDMASLIADTSGEPLSHVLECLEQERLHPGQTVARDFSQYVGGRYLWGTHLEAFYGATHAFLYELAVWNRNNLKGKLRRWTVRHMAYRKNPLDILSIGDGLGFDCLHFARKGHRVTYFELPGLSERFARKLFERTATPIQVLTDPASIPSESYDAITCFDVLEHVPDPPAFVKMLTSYLRPGGLLYVSAPFFMILPWYPTHLRSNRKFAGSLKMYRQAGLELAGGSWSWYPIVLQKPGGETPPQSTLVSLAMRCTAAVQSIGRVTAWPFLPVHLLRRINNRPFKTERESGEQLES